MGRNSILQIIQDICSSDSTVEELYLELLHINITAYRISVFPPPTPVSQFQEQQLIWISFGKEASLGPEVVDNQIAPSFLRYIWWTLGVSIEIDVEGELLSWLQF
jgi:hypothetical protein